MTGVGGGAVVMPRRPMMGSVWELREVLPGSGEPYRATVERVWRDKEGRLVGGFVGEDGHRWECELWLDQVDAGRFPTREMGRDDNLEER